MAKDHRMLTVAGMEALETAINYWDDALAAYNSLSGGGGPLAVTNSEEAEFCRELQRLLDAAYRLQDQCELMFLDQVSVYCVSGDGSVAYVTPPISVSSKFGNRKSDSDSYLTAFLTYG
jgi:hypothetical protein